MSVSARATVSTTRRLSTPLAMFVREYYRNVMNLVLLVVIPVLLILSYGSALSRLADVIPEVSLTRDMGQSLGALIYGAVGILIGSLISGELEGSFALLFFKPQDDLAS